MQSPAIVGTHQNIPGQRSLHLMPNRIRLNLWFWMAITHSVTTAKYWQAAR
jgi:hypothetical protein